MHHARSSDHLRVQRVARHQDMNPNVREMQRNQIQLLGPVDFLAIDAKSTIRGHHGDLIFLLWLHQRHHVDRSTFDDAAEPRCARDAAHENPFHAKLGKKLIHGADRAGVARIDVHHRNSRTRATCGHSVAPFPIATRMPYRLRSFVCDTKSRPEAFMRSRSSAVTLSDAASSIWPFARTTLRKTTTLNDCGASSSISLRLVSSKASRSANATWSRMTERMRSIP